ncbi:MAG TPA: hypothetical protein VFD58_13855 [Blastocatellia bacterium]|nr:hypothetical protein [Blastocatellia bacterium]
MTAITTDKLTIRFGSFTAVNEVSLKVNEGEIFSFTGPNGSGKIQTVYCVRVKSGGPVIINVPLRIAHQVAPPGLTAFPALEVRS